jgi:hypothetical protein
LARFRAPAESPRQILRLPKLLRPRLPELIKSPHAHQRLQFLRLRLNAQVEVFEVRERLPLPLGQSRSLVRPFAGFGLIVR